MSVSLDVHLLGFRLAGLEINVEEATDKFSPISSSSEVKLFNRVLNRGIKGLTNFWTPRMTS